jgi:predicted aspartyl protease
MGLTTVRATVKRSAESGEGQEVDFLVDSGAVYTLCDGTVLRTLGIRPHSRKVFFLANGKSVERDVGDAHFSFRDARGAALVIFGEPGDSNLMGATTLETLGLVLDPFRRDLLPLQMSLKAAATRPLT